jgi:hypothetical protein
VSLSLRQKVARHPIRKIVLNPWLTLGCLVLLLLLIFFGTLYQADHGLYEAQKLFFGYGFVMLGGIVPVPAASLVLWILSVQLILTMIFVMPLTWKKFGLWIVHTGLLLLLVGGFITQTMAVESQLTLAEGEVGHYTTAYHEWELAIWRARGDTNEVLAYEDKYLRTGATLDLAPYAARLTVQEYFPNAEAFTDRVTGGASPYLNTAGIAYLEARKPEKEVAENAPGLIVSINEGGQKERKALFYGLEIKPLALKLGGQRVFAQLRRKHYPLPFALKLTSFVRTLHPGTDMAKSYESYADLQDGLSSRSVRIWMNNPLRYAGYTLFQASFSQDEKGSQQSTFASVTNPGRTLPYISSITVFVGMLLHFLIRFSGYVRRTSMP